MLKFVIISIIFTTFSSNAFSKIREFETTHLKSTAGAGVGSILMEESSILNPAPIAFFNSSSLYVQKMGTKFNNDNTNNPYSAPEADRVAIIASDTKGKAKGSISYIVQKEGYSLRKRGSASISYNMGNRSAMGIAYKYTIDKIGTKDKIEPEEKYQQMTIGFTHILSKDATLGLVFIDPLQKKSEETKAIIGFQYNIQDFFSFMFDAGADYNQDLTNTFLYRVAAQVKVYDNIFIRAGKFDDTGLKEVGNGVGISWVGPKLMTEIAVKNSVLTIDDLNTQKIKESSFSLSYRF